MIASKMQKVNLLIYDVNRSVKKVYKIIYKSVDRVHELVYCIGVNRTGNRKEQNNDQQDMARIRDIQETQRHRVQTLCEEHLQGEDHLDYRLHPRKALSPIAVAFVVSAPESERSIIPSTTDAPPPPPPPRSAGRWRYRPSDAGRSSGSHPPSPPAPLAVFRRRRPPG